MSSINENTSPENVYVKVILTETMIGAVAGGAITLIMSWLIYRNSTVVPFWGPTGFVADMGLSTFMPVLAMFIAISLITRRRIRVGRLAHHMQPASRNALFRWLPNSLPLQGFFFAAVLAAICAALTAMIGYGAAIAAIPFGPFLVMKLVFGVVLGIAVAPFTIVMALANSSRRGG